MHLGFRRRAGLLVATVLALLVTGCVFRSSPSGPNPPGGATGTPTGTKAAEVEAFASVAIALPTQGALSRVDIIPSHAVIPAGETMAFSAVAYDESGKTLPLDRLEARWAMVDTQAGFISRTGIFRAGVQRGVFTNAIRVTVSQQVGGKLVTSQRLGSVSVIRPLTELDISRVQVLPEELQVEPRSHVTFIVLALDRAGVPVPGVEFTWEMLDPRAGTVDSNGRFISGEVAGSFPAAIRVVAQKRGDASQTGAATVAVVVQEPGVEEAPSKVNLYPQAVSLRPGDVMEFRALALGRNGNLFEDVTAIWSLRDPAAGDLDDQGKFRAGLTPGIYPNSVEVTVTPNVPGISEPLRATATVTVLQQLEGPGRLQRLVVSPEVVRLRARESIRLSATAISRRGTIFPSPVFRWSSLEAAVTVSANGNVTAVGSPGVYKDAVVVEMTEGVGAEQVIQRASATVIILGPLSRVEIVPQQAQATPRQLVQFTYIAYDANGVRLFDVGATWQVLDKQAGAINGVGLFTASRNLGEYSNVIRVVVKQLKPRSGGG